MPTNEIALPNILLIPCILIYDYLVGPGHPTIIPKKLS